MGYQWFDDTPLWRVTILSVAVMAASCAANPGVDPTPPPDNPLGDECEGGTPSNEPDLMGWKAGQRASLSMLRRQGVVAVR